MAKATVRKMPTKQPQRTKSMPLGGPVQKTGQQAMKPIRPYQKG